MRVLWVKAGRLLPLDTGGKLRSYHLMRQLASRHELILLSYYGGRRDAAYERELREHFPLADPMWTQTPEASAIHYATRVLHPAPYAVTKFTSPAVRARVRSYLDGQRVDVAVCDFLSASLNFPRASATPCVLFQHNVESVLWRRQAAHEPNLLKRAAFAVEAFKMDRYERETVARFPRVIAVSERDREAMATMIDASRIAVVPTGVDLTQYAPAAAARPTSPVVMFLGSMDWEANVDAVVFFCRDIWPSVVERVPDARFWIVGRNPHPRVLALGSDNVRVTGTVPSVVDYLKEAAVMVVPLRVGGGTRLKILEAMAAGRVVVSTSVGAEGLDVTNERDVLLRDDPRSFGDAVTALLLDRERQDALGRAAAQTAAGYDWREVALRFERVLVDVKEECSASAVSSPIVGVPA